MGRPTENLMGRRFGRLMVLRRTASPILHKKPTDAWWLCICDCGREKAIRSTCIRLRATNSCGCLYKDRPIVHGHSRKLKRSPEYKAWCGMRQRCFNSADPGWKNYGGRGITVCDKWLKNFSAFLEDVGRRPSENHSLDRINNDGNYEPENCRWATSAEQNHNTRVKRLESFSDEQLRTEIKRRGWELK